MDTVVMDMVGTVITDIATETAVTVMATMGMAVTDTMASVTTVDWDSVMAAMERFIRTHLAITIRRSPTTTAVVTFCLVEFTDHEFTVTPVAAGRKKQTSIRHEEIPATGI